MTTPYAVGLPKDFTVPSEKQLTDGPTHQQTSHMSGTATSPPPRPRAKQGEREHLNQFTLQG